MRSLFYVTYLGALCSLASLVLVRGEGEAKFSSADCEWKYIEQ